MKSLDYMALQDFGFSQLQNLGGCEKVRILGVVQDGLRRLLLRARRDPRSALRPHPRFCARWNRDFTEAERAAGARNRNETTATSPCAGQRSTRPGNSGPGSSHETSD